MSAIHAGATLLVVDDEQSSRRLVTTVLSRSGYRCVEAANASEALAAVDSAPPDLVVTDVTMPGGSGLALVRSLRARHPDVAAVMVTGHAEQAVVDEALDAGVYGYLTKPFDVNALLITVDAALRRRANVREGRARREELEELVRQRTQELEESRAETIERLARAVDSRDSDTGEHIDRMSRVARSLAIGLGWSDAAAETLRLACVLHDVGKVGIPDNVLLKRGPLDEEERLLMETHTGIGHGILAGAHSELLRLADEVAWTHHERFDGNGYPRGLSGDEIPLPGRIAAVADVYDAVRSDRPYRPAFTKDEALELMVAGRGSHFDPEIVDVLLALEQ